MVWTKPPASEVDGKYYIFFENTVRTVYCDDIDWERLGNPGWNWKNYQKYAAKVERYVTMCGHKCKFINASMFEDTSNQPQNFATSSKYRCIKAI